MNIRPVLCWTSPKTSVLGGVGWLALAPRHGSAPPLRLRARGELLQLAGLLKSRCEAGRTFSTHEAAVGSRSIRLTDGKSAQVVIGVGGHEYSVRESVIYDMQRWLALISGGEAVATRPGDVESISATAAGTAVTVDTVSDRECGWHFTVTTTDAVALQGYLLAAAAKDTYRALPPGLPLGPRLELFELRPQLGLGYAMELSRDGLVLHSCKHVSRTSLAQMAMAIAGAVPAEAP